MQNGFSLVLKFICDKKWKRKRYFSRKIDSILLLEKIYYILYYKKKFDYTMIRYIIFIIFQANSFSTHKVQYNYKY